MRGTIEPRQAGPASAPTDHEPDRAGGTGVEELPPLGPVRRARAAAIDRLESRLPPDAAPAAAAIMLAERGRLDPHVVGDFVDAGLAHLLAISGLHVGILATAALALTGLVLAGAARYLIAAALVLAYVALIGSPPSALRAALIFTGFAASRARGSPVRLADLLAMAAVVAALLDPLSLLDPGFQLSFAGFAGLLLGDRVAARWVGSPAAGSPRRRRLGRRLRVAARAVAASSGAFFLTAPIAAWHFQRAAPVSIVSGLVGSPLVALILLALVGVLLLPAPLAGILAAAAAALIRWLFALADRFAALPFGHALVGRPDIPGWMAFGCAVATLLLVAAGRRPWQALPLAGLAAALAIAAPAFRAWRAAGHTLLCTLDVGQGDAAVLRTRAGHWIGIDAGPRFRAADAGQRTLLPFLLSNGARRIELFILTHPDMDHVGGAASLFARLPVRRVLDSAVPVPATHYREYLESVADAGARWLVGRPGSRVVVDEVELFVLGPLPRPAEEAGRRDGREPPRPMRANEASLAIRIAVRGGFRYLNAGDAPAAEERHLVARWPAESLKATVAKVSHHGSKTSSDVRWLRAVDPEVAIISAGAANRYGHPHAIALARLDSAGVDRVWRTDLQGTACVRVGREGGWRLEGP